MRKTLVTLAAATALALTACGTDDPGPPAATAGAAPVTDDVDDADSSEDVMADEPMTDATEATESTDEDMAPATAGAYVDLATYQADPTAYQDSRVVLFFHADWCPSCRATDAALVEEGVPDGLTVVQVDFDTETALRQEHGVVQQHTFVHVDTDGTALSRWSGSPDGEDILARTG
jgi:thioredoxin 1